jgi:glycosyltransferase involved in cell wall biosynthesis
VAQTESDLRCLETHFELKTGPHSIHRGHDIQEHITAPSKQMLFGRWESYQGFLSDKLLGILKPDKVVIYPRRLRPGSVCTQQFFESIPLILREQPNTLFICPGLEGNSTVNRWISRLGIQKAVRLLPELHHVQMANLFRLAQVTVSPSIHDGTPNTLLEAMACGCFPVAGDIESLREWITDNENGLLCDPTNPEALAEAIIRGLEDVELQAKARKHNLRLIGARADYDKVMARAEKFYQQVIDATTTSIESAKRYMPS